MSESASIHPASEDERLRVYHDVHAFWGGGLPLDEFLARRLRSVAHNRAQCWVLTIAERVVSSMARHPLSFSYQGQVVKGFGVGSVFTVEDRRGQGWAEMLLREVARLSAADGCRLALLFSDIRPSYYEKLGYRTLAAVSFRCDRLGALAGAAKQASLRRIDPAKSRDFLMTAYAASHADDDLYIARDGDYWRYAISRSPLDAFFEIESPAGQPIGYARLTPRFNGDCLLELALPPNHAEMERAVLGAVAAIATQAGATAIAGWLRPSSAVAEWFVARERENAIPMIRPIDEGLAWSAGPHSPRCHFWHGDHF